MRSSALVLVVIAAPAHAYTFLGWHPSGAFYFQSTGTQVQICREDANDVPLGWPAGTSIGPGVACADLPPQVDGKSALDYARAQLKGVKNETKSPLGVELKLSVDGAKHVVTAHNGDVEQVVVGTGTSETRLKIAEQYWHPRNRAVVVVLRPEKSAEPALVLHEDLSKLLVGGPVGRRLAEKKLAHGQALYKKRDWSGAGKLFEEAIAADPELASARYARAAAEARGGVGRTAMIENLQWLKDRADKDAAAKKLLAQAKDDDAFDSWVGEPEVRELIGLPKVSTLDVPARLLERKGLWTLQGATCNRPWITLSFKKGGAATVTMAESCRGKKTSKSAAATYNKTPAGPYELELKKPLDGVPAKATIVLDETYQQLKLDALGPFEPGDASIDDSL